MTWIYALIWKETLVIVGTVALAAVLLSGCSDIDRNGTRAARFSDGSGVVIERTQSGKRWTCLMFQDTSEPDYCGYLEERQ